MGLLMAFFYIGLIVVIGWFVFWFVVWVAIWTIGGIIALISWLVNLIKERING